MDLLAKAFPRLAVYTYLLHIEYDPCIVPTSGFVDASILYDLNYRSERSSTPLESPQMIFKCTVEDNLIDFIAAFARSGKTQAVPLQQTETRISSVKQRQPSLGVSPTGEGEQPRRSSYGRCHRRRFGQ